MVKVNAVPEEDGWRCQVAVDESGKHTTHSVSVARADIDRWSRGTAREDVEDLVARSFEFLLEREPPDSILKSFKLSVIQRYFPEYDDAFRAGDG